MDDRMWQRFPWRAAPFLFAIFFVLFSHEINNFNLTIDDERHAFSNADFIPLGRWVIPLVQAVWPQLVVPQATYLIFGILISLTYCLALGLLGERELRPFHYVCFAAFIAFPAVPAQLEYAAHIIPIGLSFFTATLAVVMTLDALAHSGRDYWLRLLAAVLLCTFAAGAYQTAILIYPVILLPLVAWQTFLENPRRIPEAIRVYLLALAVMVAATLLYAIISWALIEVTGAEPASDYISGAYMGNQSSPTGFIVSRLIEFPRGMYRVIYGWWWNFGIAKYVFALALGFCGLLILRRSTGSPLTFVLTGLVLLAVVLAPGALILVSGKEMPLRTFVAAPAVFLIVFLLAWKVTDSRTVRNVVTALLVLFVIQCMYINSTQQARAWVTKRYDEAIAGAINRDIMAMVDVPEGSDIAVDFFGILDASNIYPTAPTVLLGESFVEWTRNHPVRLVNYMKLMGFYQYQLVPEDERESLIPNYADMAVWPKPGSIRIVDGVVLVRLGLCAPLPDGGNDCEFGRQKAAN